MANPTRVLFVSGEVSPFAKVSELADLVRLLPEKLQESGDYEVRIMMPRYGMISERRNRLHEVIRLSGTEVPMGEQTETLKVKVASIPGIRLQVYFMDNRAYFKRKGVFGEKVGKDFDDNAERALFFARAALETIKNLGWRPDVVHAFGTMSGLVPFLLRTEYASEPLFEEARIVYTPGSQEVEATFPNTLEMAVDLPDGVELADRHVDDIGLSFADLSAHVAGHANGNGSAAFPADPDDVIEFARGLYDQVLNSIAA